MLVLFLQSRQQTEQFTVDLTLAYKTAVITCKSASTGTSTYMYLSHLVHDYLPAYTLRSSDKIPVLFVTARAGTAYRRISHVAVIINLKPWFRFKIKLF